MTKYKKLNKMSFYIWIKQHLERNSFLKCYLYDREKSAHKDQFARPKFESLDRIRPWPIGLNHLEVCQPSGLNLASGKPKFSFLKIFRNSKNFKITKNFTWIIEVDSISHRAVVPSPEAVISWLSECGNWQCFLLDFLKWFKFQKN